MKPKITKSSGNVFLDLAFSPAESENLAIRSDLMTQLILLIRKKKWTQATAAKTLGTTQPRVSDLMRGKLEKFSTDMLIEMLTRAGARVKVSVSTSFRKTA